MYTFVQAFKYFALFYPFFAFFLEKSHTCPYFLEHTLYIYIPSYIYGIIDVHRLSLDIKAPGPPLIYLVGRLAILDPHINICVGLPNTCVVMKEFNLLLPNTLL